MEMTMRGKVFAAYAEDIAQKYGFGSGKMVAQGSPDFIARETMRGQRLLNRAQWANEKTSILLEEYEAAMAGKEEGLRLWDELAAAEKWLIENGWLRTYEAECSRSKGRRHWTVTVTYCGLTAKGWAVARKYIERKAN